MKIYLGKNKREAKEVTLKYLMDLLMGADLESNVKNCEVTSHRASDNSSSTLEIRKPFKSTYDEGGVYDIVFNFNPENENQIIDVDIYKLLWILNEDCMKRLT